MSATASSRSSVSLGRPASANAAYGGATDAAPTPGVPWGYPASGSRQGSEQTQPALQTMGQPHSREARAAFLQQHGWSQQQQQQPLMPLPAARSGDSHGASARFGSPVLLAPSWQPRAAQAVPTRLPMPPVATGKLEAAAAAEAAPTQSDSSRGTLGRAQLRREEERMGTPSDWDVARAAVTPASVTVSMDVPRANRWWIAPCLPEHS